MYLSLDRQKISPHTSFAVIKLQNNKLEEKSANAKDPIEKRVDSLKSNIFNSERKGKENIKFTQSIPIESKNNLNSINIVPKKINKSNISTAFDWTYKNTESSLNKRLENSKETESERYDPAKMKRKNLIAEFDEKGVKNYNIDMNKIKLNDEKEIQKKEICELMKKKYGTNEAKMKRNFDSVSYLNNNESLINNLKSIFYFLIFKLKKKTDKLKVFLLRILKISRV